MSAIQVYTDGVFDRTVQSEDVEPASILGRFLASQPVGEYGRLQITRGIGDARRTTVYELAAGA